VETNLLSCSLLIKAISAKSLLLDTLVSSFCLDFCLEEEDLLITEESFRVLSLELGFEPLEFQLLDTGIVFALVAGFNGVLVQTLDC
jgi:hypothetical protein